MLQVGRQQDERQRDDHGGVDEDVAVEGRYKPQRLVHVLEEAGGLGLGAFAGGRLPHGVPHPAHGADAGVAQLLRAAWVDDGVRDLGFGFRVTVSLPL